MVNIGRPSRGCAVCRKRRIKCDEKDPQCSYCIKTKQPCPGYKDSFALKWRDETSSAQQKVQRRKREQAETEELSASRQLVVYDASSKSSRTPIATTSEVHPQLREYLTDHALSFFFRNHVTIARHPNSNHGFIEFLPALFPHASSSSPLYLATTAIAMRMLEPWIDARREYKRSTALYFRALSETRAQVEASGTGCWSDEFLMTVLLLNMFEAVLGQLKGRVVESHLSGAAEVCRRRPPETFNTDVSKGLLLAVRRQLTESSLRRFTGFPSEMVPIYRAVPLSNSYSHELDYITVYIVNLQSSFVALRSGASSLPPVSFLSPCCSPSSPCCSVCSSISPPHSAAHLVSFDDDMTVDVHVILRQGFVLEELLKEWEASAPDGFLPVRVDGEGIPPSVRDAGCYGEYAYAYRSVWVAGFWIALHSARIRLWLVLNGCAEMLLQQFIRDGSDVEGQEFDIEFSMQLHRTALSTVQSSVDELCASLPYFLGDRTKHSLSVEDRDVKFPVPPGGSIPEDQYASTAGMARWFLLGPFEYASKLAVELRPGQRQWMKEQIIRMTKVHGGLREGEQNKE